MLKDTNPKDAVGVRKWRQYCTVPITIIWELGVAMLEGARKYGRHNYRVAGVRASVYVDAAKGHIDSWWEGEDVDADSGLSHITKAMASLAVLRDAMINDMVTDDRPPKVKDFDTFKAGLGKVVDEIMERYPDARDPFTELGQQAVRTSSPTVTPEEVLARVAEEKSRVALKAKAALEEVAVQTTERVGLVEVRHTIYKAPDHDLAHTVGGVSILHPSSENYDREHVFEGLTSQQLCRLIKAKAAPHNGGMDSDLLIYHPAAFDDAAHLVMGEIVFQPLREVRLDFGDGGFRECKTRLTSDQWFLACPGVRVTPRPHHGLTAFSTGSGE